MKKTNKALKIIGTILGILLALGIGLYFYVTNHTQIVVGFIQKGIYGESSPNSFDPLNTPGKGLTAAGQYKINDIAFGTDYPTAFLLGSEYRNDLIAMAEKLKEAEVEHILVDPLAEYGEVKPHCFVANERVDEIAKDAFDRMMAFINNKTK